MKKNLHILSIAVLIAGITILMTACSNPSKKVDDNLVLSATDTTGLSDFQAWKTWNERKDAMLYYTPGTQNAQVNNTVKKTAPARKVSTTPATQPTQPAKKKGWSKAAKGAVIGAAAGAIGGAIINKKNRVLGGVIGGVLGGGVGYGIGRSMDKKDGR